MALEVTVSDVPSRVGATTEAAQGSSRVFLVIPAYNEVANLPALLERVDGVLAGGGVPYRAVVVDDGSVDGTADAVRHLQGSLPIDMLRHGQNRGVGAGFATGLEAACAAARPRDVVIMMEADRTSDPELLPQMLEAIQRGHDLVIASRYQPGGGYEGFPLRRLGLSVGANLLMRLRFPIRGVKDYTIFFRAYRVELLQRGFRHYGKYFLQCRTFACNVELLLKLCRFRPRIVEIPFWYRYGLKRGRSKLAVWRTIREDLQLVNSRIGSCRAGVRDRTPHAQEVGWEDSVRDNAVTCEATRQADGS